MCKYKEIIAFCIFFSISFVFMSKVVKNVDPIVSTFITYGIATVFFTLINIKNLRETLNILLREKMLVFKINISTLMNTLLAFYVVLYISPIAYIIVFFSGLSFFNSLYNYRDVRSLEMTINMLAISLAVFISFLMSNANLVDTITGVTLTLTSTVFASFYMRESAMLHTKTDISVPQILSIRFYLVIVLCGFYSVYSISHQSISTSDLSLLFLISVTGSIVPLFLMQKSITTLGPKLTAQFTPLTPILCLMFMALIEKQHFSILEISLTFLIALVMLCQLILKPNNIKDKNDE
ncbi:DMT family transporter [Psychromonas sp. SP041]|uniref:DMT family transporter n=1 Tax=Psychromonas sp. SP041 TaxID=1365007 RepID=UPI0010C7D158|nr:DMT family transporter [Psychromonas sp. SP041]